MTHASADYIRDALTIEMEHIMLPKALLPLQEEMMSHHTRLHPLPWPKLISMSDAGEFPC